MKTKNWLLSLWTICTVICFASCEEWGEKDPIPGLDVNPKLEKIISFTFEDDAEIDPAIIQYLPYDGGNTPTIVSDAELDSKVLHMNGGYARIENPLNDVKVQNGVSLTFLMKQVPQTDEEGEPIAQDVEGALFSFQDEEGVNKMFFTANCWLDYAGSTGTYEDNNPVTDYKTALIANDGEWHYVAVSIRKDGYAVYVDGYKKIDKVVSGVVFSGIYEFMATAPYLYIGAGSDTETSEWMVDDFTVYRNQITSSEITDPRSPNESGDGVPYIIIGEEDFSSDFFGPKSDLITIKEGEMIHFGFYNYTDGSENYKNWVLALTNGKAFGEDGYAEYFVLRADAYGWGDGNFVLDNIGSTVTDWALFREDMKGAYVDLTIKRTGNRVDITAVTTTKSNTIYTMTFYYEGELANTIGAFLTVDHSYIAVNPHDTYVNEGEAFDKGTYVVGEPDFSSGWWTTFSEFYVVPGETSIPYCFALNLTSNQAASFKNLALVVTNGANRGEEFFVVRADGDKDNNASWGNADYDPSVLTSPFDAGTIISQLHGSYIQIFVTHTGTRVDVTMRVTTAAGVTIGELKTYHPNVTSQDIGLFLAVENASIDIRAVGYLPYLLKVNE